MDARLELSTTHRRRKCLPNHHHHHQHLGSSIDTTLHQFGYHQRKTRLIHDGGGSQICRAQLHEDLVVVELQQQVLCNCTSRYHKHSLSTPAVWLLSIDISRIPVGRNSGDIYQTVYELRYVYSVQKSLLPGDTGQPSTVNLYCYTIWFVAKSWREQQRRI